MIRVKVNSKSELAEDREGKSGLYCVIYCCDDRLLSRAVLPCFPDNKTGLILIFTPKYGTRAYFRGMYYFDISKNEVTK